MREPAPGPIGDVVPDPAPSGRTQRPLLLVSAVFLALQVVLTDHGDDRSGAAVLWFTVGCLLLWLVDRRRSRVARGVIVVTALVGAIVTGLAVLETPQAALLASAHLGHALPLLTGPVPRHVRTGR